MIFSQKAAPKVLEWQSYGNFRKVTQNPQFLIKCKKETKRNFSKSRPRLKNPTAFWRKWHYILSSLHL